MNDRNIWIRRIFARIQAFALVAALGLTLALAGWLLGGGEMAWAAFIAVLGLFWLQPLMAPQLMLKIQGGRPLAPAEAPRLHQLLSVLARKAGLSRPPQLYYLPSRVMNAFTIGSRDLAVVGVSDGLLRHLDQDQVAAVLAHEIAHITNNDTRVMGFAALLSRLIQGISLVGQVLLIVNLPLILAGHQIVNLGGILILILAPYAGLLLQLALSRSREYLADADAAAFMGSPQPLATALARIEQHNHGLRRRLLWRWPGAGRVENAMLRTHPPTRERIRRLLELPGARRRPPRRPARASFGPTVFGRLDMRSRRAPCRSYGLCP